MNHQSTNHFNRLQGKSSPSLEQFFASINPDILIDKSYPASSSSDAKSGRGISSSKMLKPIRAATTAKLNASNKKHNDHELVYTMTDGSKSSLVQRIGNYIRFYCDFRKFYALMKDVESVFQSPVIHNSNSESEKHCKDLIVSLDFLLKKVKSNHMKWFNSICAVQGKHKFVRKVILEKELQKLSEVVHVPHWKSEDIDILFDYISNGKGYFEKFDLRIAFRKHRLTTKKIASLNETAQIIGKLGKYLTKNGLYLRDLSSELSDKPTHQLISSKGLDSAITILITDFSNAHGSNRKKMDLLINRNNDLDSEVNSIQSDYSNESFGSLNSRSNHGNYRKSSKNGNIPFSRNLKMLDPLVDNSNDNVSELNESAPILEKRLPPLPKVPIKKKGSESSGPESDFHSSSQLFSDRTAADRQTLSHFRDVIGNFDRRILIAKRKLDSIK